MSQSPYVTFLVHDFPHSRLEFPIRVFIRSRRRHEVPREETQGVCFWCLMLNISLYNNSFTHLKRNRRGRVCDADLREPARGTAKCA